MVAMHMPPPLRDWWLVRVALLLALTMLFLAVHAPRGRRRYLDGVKKTLKKTAAEQARERDAEIFRKALDAGRLRMKEGRYVEPDSNEVVQVPAGWPALSTTLFTSSGAVLGKLAHGLVVLNDRPQPALSERERDQLFELQEWLEEASATGDRFYLDLLPELMAVIYRAPKTEKATLAQYVSHLRHWAHSVQAQPLERPLGGVSMPTDDQIGNLRMRILVALDPKFSEVKWRFVTAELSTVSLSPKGGRSKKGIVRAAAKLACCVGAFDSVKGDDKDEIDRLAERIRKAQAGA